MKPLLPNSFKTFLQRFNNFKDAEIRSFEVISPTNITLTLAAQDSARAHDWITVTLSFEGVTNAKLIEENRFSFVDMSEGISLLNEADSIAIGIGFYNNLNAIQNATSFIISKSLKYQEGKF